MKLSRIMGILALGSAFLATTEARAAAPDAPVVDKVIPLTPDPVKKAKGVFFFDDLETETDLRKNYHDTGLTSGRFKVSSKDVFGGKRSIEMDYLPKEEMQGDPGSAGWCWRFFGDNPKTSRIPADERKKYTVAVARWYHKFPEEFKPRDGNHWPPKMTRMRCFHRGGWGGAYTYLFWIAGKDGHISLERHTKSPKAHREWLPNYATKFKFSDRINQGRWIHFEFRIEIGDGQRQDKWQGWADGVMIGEATTDDMTGGWREFGLNGMSWDTYWNGGSPVRQSRFYDDLSLSTKPMGPARTSLNPVIVTGQLRDKDEGDSLKAWEVEVAATEQKPLVCERKFDGVEFRAKPAELATEVVWKGLAQGKDRDITVDAKHGSFSGKLEGEDKLGPNQMYMCRIRHQDAGGEWSAWSGWHAAFATDWADETPADEKVPPKGYYLGQAARSAKKTAAVFSAREAVF